MIERFLKNINMRNLNLANLPLAKKQNLNSNENFLPVGYVTHDHDTYPKVLAVV